MIDLSKQLFCMRRRYNELKRSSGTVDLSEMVQPLEDILFEHLFYAHIYRL